MSPAELIRRHHSWVARDLERTLALSFDRRPIQLAPGAMFARLNGV